MKTIQWGAIVVAVSCLVLPGLAFGEGGMKLPNLNPFAKKKAASGAGSPPTSGWHMPKLWPSTSAAKSKAKSSGPSAWEKMTNGTKSMVSKTTDALNPWNDKKDEPPPKPSGSKSAFSQASAKKDSSKKSSWMPSMPWSSEEQEQKPKTVNDFLSQPRVSP